MTGLSTASGPHARVAHRLAHRPHGDRRRGSCARGRMNLRAAAAPRRRRGDDFASARCPFCAGQRAPTRRRPCYEQTRCARPLARPRRAEQVSGGDAARRSIARPCAASRRRQPGFGVHEVIIESPRHVDRTSGALDVRSCATCSTPMRERLRHWRDDGRLALRPGVQELRARGPGRRSRICTANSIALPACRRRSSANCVEREDAFGKHRLCRIAGLIEQERAAGERIVLDRDGYRRVLPVRQLCSRTKCGCCRRSHEPSFEHAMSTDACAIVWRMCCTTLIARIEAIVPDGVATTCCCARRPWHVDSDDSVSLADRAAAALNAIRRAGSGDRDLYQSAPPERAAQQLCGLALAFCSIRGLDFDDLGKLTALGGQFDQPHGSLTVLRHAAQFCR